ncbi:MAG: hypothetical protein J6O17_00615 [Eubacterium sp.]|nr:hypothetical protein [Eubacterium sp.]
MLTIFYICAVILIIAMGYIYINAVNKVNKADIAARDAGSDIDTCLWDMTHNLGIVVKALKEMGIEPEMPQDQSVLLTIGMTSASQQLVAKNAEERMSIVKPAAEEAGITEKEDIAKALQKYENARIELIGAGTKYNAMVAKFNATISHFPASFIASHKSKSPKMIFVYQPGQKTE